MPSKDKEVLRKARQKHEKKLTKLGYLRRYFWVHKDWDGSLNDLGEFIWVKEHKKKKKIEENEK